MSRSDNAAGETYAWKSRLASIIPPFSGTFISPHNGNMYKTDDIKLKKGKV